MALMISARKAKMTKYRFNLDSELSDSRMDE